MTKCGNSLTLLGDFVVDRVNHKGELCAQDCYKGSSEWRTLCSWPRREKVLLVNNVPVVYFGRTNDNKPIYWSPSAEVDAASNSADNSTSGIVYNKHYYWNITGGEYQVDGEPVYQYIFRQHRRTNKDNKYDNFLEWFVPWYESVDGKLVKHDSLPSGRFVSNDLYEITLVSKKIWGYLPEWTSITIDQFGGFTNTEMFNADGKVVKFSVWRDDGGNPLTLPLQPRVVPPEHKSDYRSKINDKLHYGMTVENGALVDSVWATFSGHGTITRVNGKQIDLDGDKICKVVDFSVSVGGDGLEVSAVVHTSSNNRKVFDYLDVTEYEEVSGITCEIEDCEED